MAVFDTGATRIAAYQKSKQQKKLEQLRRNAEKYEEIFQEDSSCRNLRNYNHALAALKQYEKKLNLSDE